MEPWLHLSIMIGGDVSFIYTTDHDEHMDSRIYVFNVLLVEKKDNPHGEYIPHSLDYKKNLEYPSRMVYLILRVNSSHTQSKKLSCLYCLIFILPQSPWASRSFRLEWQA